MKSKDSHITKARKLEDKGDLYKSRNKHQKAFAAYQKALDLDDTRLELYDKLIKLHEEYNDNWTEDDFAYNLHLTMKKQEVVNPIFRRINARQDPEFKEVRRLIKKMLDAKTDEEETKFVEEIVAYEFDALYPLIDFILSFKELGKRKDPKPQ